MSLEESYVPYSFMTIQICMWTIYCWSLKELTKEKSHNAPSTSSGNSRWVLEAVTNKWITRTGKLIQKRKRFMGAHGSVVGWGTTLQARRSPVWVTDDVDFFNLPNPSSRTMALGLTQPLTEMSTRNLPGSKEQLVHRADNLATICEPNVWKCGSFILSQP
jgi:hypothetical protein